MNWGGMPYRRKKKDQFCYCFCWVVIVRNGDTTSDYTYNSQFLRVICRNAFPNQIH